MNDKRIVDRLIERRAQKNGHKGGVIWFTGLSGSGKSTLAMSLERALFMKGLHVFVLDGDNLRHGICRDLGFSREDREENIRRVIAISEHLVNSGVIVITAFISPYKVDRMTARSVIGSSFLEVFLDPGIAFCEARDLKGLYKKARNGQIPNFTGVSAPYEKPVSPELRLDTSKFDIDQCTKQLFCSALGMFLMTD